MFYSNITGKTYSTEGRRRMAEGGSKGGKSVTGHPHSEESKAKLSAAQKARWAKNRDRYMENRKSIPRTEEWLKNQSEGIKRAWARDDGTRRAEYAERRGKSNKTPEHRAKIGAYWKDREKTEIQKERMRQAKLDVPKSAIHVAHMRVSQNKRWAAARGEMWAVRWYLENGKEVPSYPDRTQTPESYVFRARREAMIEKLKREGIFI